MITEDRTSLIQTGAAAPKLAIERKLHGPVTCLRLSGTIDEQFDGPGLARTLSARYLILDLGGIERISSFGIRQWIDFVAAAGARVGGIYYVECSPKIVDQFNMVGNFGGSGHIISFYAPYRCDACDHDRRHIFRTDEDTPLWRAGQAPAFSCAICGGPEYFDEDPASYFSFVAQQPSAAYPQEVMVFLRTQLNYGQGGQRKLRIEKRIDGRVTYLKLSGDLDSDLRAQKVAEGLEGDVVFDVGEVMSIDPVGAAQWRRLVKMLDGRAKESERVDGFHLLAVPPAFLERLCRPEDLAPRGQVLSVMVPYNCQVCRTVTRRLVDLLAHGGELRAGRVPRAQCASCGGPAQCVVSELWLTRLRTLDHPRIGDALHRAILRLHLDTSAPPVQGASTVLPPVPLTQPSEARDLREAAPPADQDTRPLRIVSASRIAMLLRIPGLLPAALVVVLSLSGAIVYRILAPPGRHASPWAVVETSGPRPAWAGARPGASLPGGPGGRLEVIGESPQVRDRQEAVWSAQVMAWAAFFGHVGERIAARDPLLSRTAGAATFSPNASAGRETLSGLLAFLRAQHRDIIDQTTFEIYWERLGHPAHPTEFAYHALVRASFTQELVERLVGEYSQPQTTLGVRAYPVLPGLTRSGNVRAGAFVAELRPQSPLSASGVRPGDIVFRVGNEHIRSAIGLRDALERSLERAAEQRGVLPISIERDGRRLDLEWRPGKRRARR